ncbi:MAG: hypothetical protein J3Q66DRAFT_401662 [Benniella sp.]|nr:MAG: hypothetical protein J3Q66DRAFT_401662 [Benniella sp.]
MKPRLKGLRKAESSEELDTLWANFETQFPNARAFNQYMKKNWIAPTKRSKWVLYVREDYQHIDTNNLLESWFKALKQHCLEGKRHLRVDHIIFILQGAIDRDFRTQYVKVKQGIQPTKPSRYDVERKSKAETLELEAARKMIRRDDESKGNVRV